MTTEHAIAYLVMFVFVSTALAIVASWLEGRAARKVQK